MPELVFDHDQRRAAVEQIGRQRVPQQMGKHAPADLRNYNANTDLSWTQSAINYFTEAESGLDTYVDQPVFYTWTANPTYMLPEQIPGTLMNTAYQYLLPHTYLSLGSSGTSYRVNLVDANGSPIANAPISVVSIDTANAWAPTDRVMTGVVPSTATCAVIGIRANTEGVTMDAPTGQADLGPITVHYTDVSNTSRTWQSAYATPLKIALTPSTTLGDNLSAPGSVKCGGNPGILSCPGVVLYSGCSDVGHRHSRSCRLCDDDLRRQQQ